MFNVCFEICQSKLFKLEKHRSKRHLYSPVGIRLRPQGSSSLELGVGVLRQIGHHRLLIHVGINQLLGLDQLAHVEPVIGQAHGLGGVLHRILGIPQLPIGTETRSTGVDKGAHSLARGPVVGKVVDGQVGYLGVYPVQQAASGRVI